MPRGKFYFPSINPLAIPTTHAVIKLLPVTTVDVIDKTLKALSEVSA